MNLPVLLLLLAAAPTPPADPPVLELMKTELKAYGPEVRSPWVKEWMSAVASLPSQPKRVFYRTKDRSKAFTEAEYARLTDAQKKDVEKKDCDDEVYYGRITEPLGYTRAFDVLAARGFRPKGKRVLDFGYGNIGQLEGLVKVGASAAGIEVDPLLPLLYEKANRPELRIFHGYFPKDEALTKSVGAGWNLIISKNTLKRGYVHPEDGKKAELELGVSDAQFVARIIEMLEPGGWFYVYNITPKPAPKGQPFVPMSDGRSPFSRESYEKAGFEVVAFDEDDTAAVRVMGKAFGWDEPNKDLFAHYTLVRKPQNK